MIFGIGMDMIEIERIQKACETQAFLSRVYTEEERRQAGKNISRLAGDFAVKEAVAKAFGTGFRGFLPGDIEALRDENGKPYVNLYRGAEKAAAERGIEKLYVSISNTRDYAAAYVIAETKQS